MKTTFSTCILAMLVFVAGCKKDSNLSIIGVWTCGGVGGSTLYLDADNTYGMLIGGPTGVEYGGPGHTYSVSNSNLTFLDNNAVCSGNQIGIYSYYIFQGANSAMMTLTVINDPCLKRSNLLPCTYTKQ